MTDAVNKGISIQVSGFSVQVSGGKEFSGVSVQVSRGIEDQVLEKKAVTAKSYMDKECIRMLNGLEKTLERKLPERERRWQVKEDSVEYSANDNLQTLGWPVELF